MASSALTTSRKDSQTIVIFLTDGKPECYDGSATDLEYFNKGLAAAQNIKCNKFYAVGVGLGNNVPEQWGSHGSLTPLGLLGKIADQCVR